MENKYIEMIKQLTELLRRYLKQIMSDDTLTLTAKCNKAYFDALLTEGFTEEQAMEILLASSITQPDIYKN